MRAFMWRSSTQRLPGLTGVAGLGLIVGLSMSGCALPKVSPEHGLPPLVVVGGTAEIPDDYLIQSGTMPAPRGFRVSLAKLDGTTLASGTIVSASGEFSISVPRSELNGGGSLYEVTLRNGLGAAIYSAPAQVHSHGSFGRVQITAASTAVILGLKTSHQMGRPIQGWDFAQIVKDPSVLLFAQRIAKDAAERSNQAPGQTLLSSNPLPAEFQSGVYQVITIAERKSR